MCGLGLGSDYLEGLLESRAGWGGLGGLSGRPGGSLWGSAEARVRVGVHTPPEALLLLDAVRRWVRSVRLEARECSVL